MTSVSAALPRRPWSDRRRLAVFLLIAFVVSWSAWPLTLLNPASTPFLPYGPTIAALVVTALAGRRGDVRLLLRRLAHWRAHPAWYAAAFLLPVLVFGLPALIAVELGVPADTGGPFPWASLPVLFAVRTIVGGPLGEELGWRGFVLPLLRRRHGALAASLLIALVWAPWHLPTMLAGPATEQRPVAQFVIWVLAASILHTWMYEGTGGSVLIVTLFHGALNTTASLLMPLFTGPGYTLAWWLAAAAMSGAAAAVVCRGDWRSPLLEPARPPGAPHPPKILVVGSGFGGFHAARELELRLPGPAADITLVSPADHLTYGPLLPNVAAGVTEPRHVTVALHAVLRRTRHLTAELVGLDTAGRTAVLATRGGAVRQERFDRLILAPGAVAHLPAVPGLAEHALSLKTLRDAVSARDHMLRQLDLADGADDRDERRARSTFVVVGAGYTGTETAAQLRRLVRLALPRFPRLRPSDVRFLLVERADQVLPELGPPLSRRAMSTLHDRGIEVRLGTTVMEVTAETVRLSDGDTVPSHTVIWAAGVTVDPVVTGLGLPLHDGRLRVDTTLQVPGATGVYALGDAAAVPDLTRPGRCTAPTAQHAQRQGRAAARNVAASLGHGRARPYRHRDLGLVVDLGPFSAVARPLGIPLWGPVAALVTRGYHLLALPSGAAQLRVLTDWLLDVVLRPQLTVVDLEDEANRARIPDGSISR